VLLVYLKSKHRKETMKREFVFQFMYIIEHGNIFLRGETKYYCESRALQNVLNVMIVVF
jgi:hypothetical protein